MKKMKRVPKIHTFASTGKFSEIAHRVMWCLEVSAIILYQLLHLMNSQWIKNRKSMSNRGSQISRKRVYKCKKLPSLTMILSNLVISNRRIRVIR